LLDASSVKSQLALSSPPRNGPLVKPERYWLAGA
jgi:hypothetical protein